MNHGTTSTPRLRGPRTCLAPIDAPAPLAPPRTARLAVLLYGVLCYALSLAVFAYTAGFLGNFLTPTRLDGTASGPVGPAIAIDLLLLALFGLQHSVMARPWFKRWWTRTVPEAAERSTYMLLTCLALAALFAFWRPLGGVVWDLQSPLARAVAFGVYALGWAVLLLATFLINHFDLFGLRQVWLFARGRTYRPLPFRTPWFYRFIRHPLYVGWFMLFWATPTMTAAHLVFALGMTVYILMAIPFEERDLMEVHPEYSAYRERTPKFVPRIGGTGTAR